MVPATIVIARRRGQPPPLRIRAIVHWDWLRTSAAHIEAVRLLGQRELHRFVSVIPDMVATSTGMETE